MSVLPTRETPASSPAERGSGRLNVGMGLMMMVVALLGLGGLFETSSAPPESTLSLISGSQIAWGLMPVEQLVYYAWKVCFAHLGNMGTLNMAGGAVLWYLGPRVLWHRLLAWTLLGGGLLHPGAWALVGLTGVAAWRELGKPGLVAVVLVLLILVGQLSLAQMRKYRHLRDRF